MTKTILVADDSKTIQNVVSLTFRATDFKVVSVHDGDEAIRRIPELRPDIVLADVAMPGRNGYDLCRDMKSSAHTAHIPVLLLACSFEPFDDRRANDARADGFIKKPFDSQSLIDRVTQLTGARAPEMPMSFAASLAARQKTDAVPSGLGARAGSAAPVSGAFAGGGGAAAAAAANAGGMPGKSASSPALGSRPIASDLGVPASAGLGAASAGVSSSAASSGPAVPPAPSAPLSWSARAPSTGRAAAEPEREREREPAPYAPPREPPPLTAAQHAQHAQHAAAQSKAPTPSGVMIEEPEFLDETQVVDDYDDAAARAVPSLEPPRPPNAAEHAERAKVDVWAFADEDQKTTPMVRKAPAPAVAPVRSNDVRAVPPMQAAPESDIEAIEEIEIDDVAPGRKQRDAAMDAAVAKTAAVAAPAVAAAAAIVVPGMSNEELVRVAREVIERIAWEVVPELAETIIRAELDRLLGDR